jgi:regulator of RNase E activity RraA
MDIDDHPGTGAFVGEVHANILRALGCAGLVTNGAVRDLPAVGDLGFQMFSAVTSPSHAFAHIVDFGGAVDVAGLHVESGAVLLADRHGLVMVPDPLVGALPTTVSEMKARERAVIDFCRSPGFSVDGLRTIVQQLG